MNRRRAEYETADWSLSDTELAARLGVKKQAVSAARRARGIPPAAGHGGWRHGDEGDALWRKLRARWRALSTAQRREVLRFVATLLSG